MHHALDGLDLADQILRHGLAIGLVERKDLVPEVFAFAVFDKGEIPGLFLPQNAQQHARHHHQRVGREAVRALHVFVGEKATVDEGRAVHQKYGFSVKVQAFFK